MKREEFEIEDHLDLNGQWLKVETKGILFDFPGSYLEEHETQFEYQELKISGIDCIGSGFFSPAFFINILEPALYEYIKSR